MCLRFRMTTSVPCVVRVYACHCVCADLRTACASVTACALMRSCLRVALRVLALSHCVVSRLGVALGNVRAVCLRRTAPRIACALSHRLTLRLIVSYPNPRTYLLLPRSLALACVPALGRACACVMPACVRAKSVPTSRAGGGGSGAPRAFERVPTAGAG